MNYLITSIGSMSASSVIRSIRSTLPNKIIGCNSTPKNWIFNSTLVDEYFEVPHSDQEERYIKALLSICKKNKISHVIALTDLEIDALDKHRDLFRKINTKLCIPDENQIKITRDKLKIFHLFKNEKKIKPIPSFELDFFHPRKIINPLILKPRNGRSSQGIIKIKTIKEFLFHQSNLKNKNYIVQPFIDGDIYVSDILRQKSSDTTIVATRKELIRTSNGAGISVEIGPNRKIQKMAIEISQKIDINGCINIEYIKTKKYLYVMDINPRFSAGIEFSRMSGYDFPKNMIACFSKNDKKSIEKQKKIKKLKIEKTFTEKLIS